MSDEYIWLTKQLVYKGDDYKEFYKIKNEVVLPFIRETGGKDHVRRWYMSLKYEEGSKIPDVRMYFELEDHSLLYFPSEIRDNFIIKEEDPVKPINTDPDIIHSAMEASYAVCSILKEYPTMEERDTYKCSKLIWMRCAGFLYDRDGWWALHFFFNNLNCSDEEGYKWLARKTGGIDELVNYMAGNRKLKFWWRRLKRRFK